MHERRARVVRPSRKEDQGNERESLWHDYYVRSDQALIIYHDGEKEKHDVEQYLIEVVYNHLDPSDAFVPSLNISHVFKLSPHLPANVLSNLEHLEEMM
jgi:hypothetical protein